MRLKIYFREFILSLYPYSNEALSLERLLEPFDIKISSISADTIFIGHVLDYLSQEFSSNMQIDPVDVATAAYELGYEPAKLILDNIPLIFTKDQNFQADI